MAKHGHRASDGWWGAVAGPDVRKNAHAQAAVLHILEHAIWVNIHTLPHEQHVVEVRVPDGYGARWSADGSEFRGFLEPHTADGHERRWRH
jgi:hypothetical protein